MSRTAVAIIIALALVLLFQNGWLWLRRARRRWRAKRRSRRAVRGEVEAESSVKKHGYDVVERQVDTTWTIHIDGDPVEINLRADLLLSRGSQSFIADVKTGKSAPRITTASTRRQLLEYTFAYPVDGALLIDMESETLSRVDFGPVERQLRRPISHLIAAFFVGAAVAVTISPWW